MSGGEMFQTVYGPNSDGGPISLEEVITDIIEDEVAKYTNTRLAIEEAGGLDPAIVKQLRWGALCEPNLPAVGAQHRIMAALAMFGGDDQ